MKSLSLLEVGSGESFSRALRNAAKVPRLLLISGAMGCSQKYTEKSGYYLEGGGKQYFVPQSPAVEPSQIKEYWHTDWNAPTSALRTIRNAGKIDECDL